MGSPSTLKASSDAKIVQFADEGKVLPDGSKVIYAENPETIVLYHKKPAHPGVTYVYHRQSGQIFLNGKPGNNKDKREMIRLGTYMLSNANEEDLVTLTVNQKKSHGA